MRRSNALWGMILIFIGAFWLLDSNDWVKIDILGSVMTLWPVFIIAAGITYFLKRESHIQRVILWLLVFAVIGGYAVYLGHDNINESDFNKKYVMKPEYESASIKISIAGAKLDIGSSNQDLADVTTSLKGIKADFSESKNPKINYSQKVQRQQWRRSQKFNVNLNRNIPWDIELNTGAVQGTLDFKDFPLKNCTINTAGCDLNIVAGDKQKDSKIVINGGAVNINLIIPENVGVKINSSSAVTKINGDVYTAKANGNYQSDNFNTADSRLYFDIASAASNIVINR